MIEEPQFAHAVPAPQGDSESADPHSDPMDRTDGHEARDVTEDARIFGVVRSTDGHAGFLRYLRRHPDVYRWLVDRLHSERERGRAEGRNAGMAAALVAAPGGVPADLVDGLREGADFVILIDGVSVACVLSPGVPTGIDPDREIRVYRAVREVYGNLVARPPSADKLQYESAVPPELAALGWMQGGLMVYACAAGAGRHALRTARRLLSQQGPRGGRIAAFIPLPLIAAALQRLGATSVQAASTATTTGTAVASAATTMVLGTAMLTAPIYTSLEGTAAPPARVRMVDVPQPIGEPERTVPPGSHPVREKSPDEGARRPEPLKATAKAAPRPIISPPPIAPPEEAPQPPAPETGEQTQTVDPAPQGQEPPSSEPPTTDPPPTGCGTVTGAGDGCAPAAPQSEAPPEPAPEQPPSDDPSDPASPQTPILLNVAFPSTWTPTGLNDPRLVRFRGATWYYVDSEAKARTRPEPRARKCRSRRSGSRSEHRRRHRLALQCGRTKAGSVTRPPTGAKGVPRARAAARRARKVRPGLRSVLAHGVVGRGWPFGGHCRGGRQALKRPGASRPKNTGVIMREANDIHASDERR